MLLATLPAWQHGRFLEIFSTKGAEKRKQHGSKGALVFRDPAENDRVWVLFDWDEQGWASFVSDPEGAWFVFGCDGEERAGAIFFPAPGAPAISKRPGKRGKPQAGGFAGTY